MPKNKIEETNRKILGRDMPRILNSIGITNGDVNLTEEEIEQIELDKENMKIINVLIYDYYDELEKLIFEKQKIIDIKKQLLKQGRQENNQIVGMIENFICHGHYEYMLDKNIDLNGDSYMNNSVIEDVKKLKRELGNKAKMIVETKNEGDFFIRDEETYYIGKETISHLKNLIDDIEEDKVISEQEEMLLKNIEEICIEEAQLKGLEEENDIELD